MINLNETLSHLGSNLSSQTLTKFTAHIFFFLPLQQLQSSSAWNPTMPATAVVLRSTANRKRLRRFTFADLTPEASIHGRMVVSPRALLPDCAL